MENLLIKYMTDRISEEMKTNNVSRPVITISREHGCNAWEIGNSLKEKLNRYNKNNDSNIWKCINKEVIEKSALYLKAHPENISHIFDAKTINLLGEIITSFSNNKYISDDKIKNTIFSIISSYSKEGNNIIIGRAGCYIAKNIKNAIHIKLVAPLDFRIENIKNIYNISKSDAKKQIIDIDKKRDNFINFYKKNDDDKIFHIIYNTKLLSTNEIVDSMYSLLNNHINQ